MSIEYAKAKQIKTDGGTTVEAELANKASTSALSTKQDTLPANSLGLINKTAGSSKFLREDGTWQTVSSGGGGLDPSDIDTVSLSDSDSKVPSSKLMASIIDELPSGGDGDGILQLPVMALNELNLVSTGHNISAYPNLRDLDYGYYFTYAGFLLKRKEGGYDYYTYHQVNDRVNFANFYVNVTGGGSITVFDNYGAGGKKIAFTPPVNGVTYGMLDGDWTPISATPTLGGEYLLEVYNMISDSSLDMADYPFINGLPYGDYKIEKSPDSVNLEMGMGQLSIIPFSGQRLIRYLIQVDSPADSVESLKLATGARLINSSGIEEEGYRRDIRSS